MQDSQLQRTEEIRATLAQLEDPKGGELPEAEIRQVQTHSAEYVPYLIDLIRRATEFVRREERPCETCGHLFALFLLTEFRAQEAWPIIREALLLPDDGPFDLFSDAITEDLSSMLPVFTAEHSEWLDDLISNREAHLHVRWAACDAFMHLVRSGQVTREDAIGRLHGHLRKAIEMREDEVCIPLVMILADFGGTVALEDIRAAFQLDLVDEGMVTCEEVEDDFENPDEVFQSHLRYCRPTGIADTVESLSDWHFGAGEADDDEYGEVIADNDADDDDEGFDSSRKNWAVPENVEPGFVAEPIRNEGLHVGRNDPCPCGSGKKYKKCCLRH